MKRQIRSYTRVVFSKTILDFRPKGEILYSFSDQNGAKTIPLGATHAYTYGLNKELPPGFNRRHILMKVSNFYAESALHLMFSISMYSKRTFQFVITRRKKIPYFVYRSRTFTQDIHLLLKQQLATFVKSTSVKGSKSKIRCIYSSPLVPVQGSWSLVSKLTIAPMLLLLSLIKPLIS